MSTTTCWWPSGHFWSIPDGAQTRECLFCGCRSPAAGTSADVEWMRARSYQATTRDVLTVSAGSPQPPAWVEEEGPL